MSRGTNLSAGSENTFCVYFFLASDTGEVDSGAASGVGVTTTVETALVINPPATGGGTVKMSRWTAPWPCRVAEVFVEGTRVASGDIEYRVRRHDVAAYATADDIIRNAIGGAATDAIKTSHTAGGYTRKRYTGIPQDTNVAPYFHVTTVSSDTATGFQYSEVVLAAGDRLSATYRKTASSNDSVTHLRCIVTLAKLDTVSS
jgi:hypothetical protein